MTLDPTYPLMVNRFNTTAFAGWGPSSLSVTPDPAVLKMDTLMNATPTSTFNDDHRNAIRHHSPSRAMPWRSRATKDRVGVTGIKTEFKPDVQADPAAIVICSALNDSESHHRDFVALWHEYIVAQAFVSSLIQSNAEWSSKDVFSKEFVGDVEEPCQPPVAALKADSREVSFSTVPGGALRSRLSRTLLPVCKCTLVTNRVEPCPAIDGGN
ncbi:hypothetical protein CPC08DRAFT_753870 [Agrocybe pediades]|nr:hypothetical protein CPC08DRAFT_753870 [Agrocybe pediades]